MKIDLCVHKAIASLVVGLAFNVSGCSMPRYDNLVYEMRSSCDGNLKVMIRHDTDPRELKAEIDERSRDTPDAQRIVKLEAVDQFLHVTFTSGVWCQFINGDTQGECYTARGATTRAACVADLVSLEVLPPTRNDGF